MYIFTCIKKYQFLYESARNRFDFGYIDIDLFIASTISRHVGTFFKWRGGTISTFNGGGGDLRGGASREKLVRGTAPEIVRYPTSDLLRLCAIRGLSCPFFNSFL